MSCGPQCRCCLIGSCCPPGSKEQRASLKTWLREKMKGLGYFKEDEVNVLVDAWLDELPWKPKSASE